MAYDIELNPKVKDNGEIEKLEKKIEKITDKEISLKVHAESDLTAKKLDNLITAAARLKEIRSSNKTVNFTVSAVDNSNSLDNLLTKLNEIKNLAERNIAFTLNVQNTGIDDPKKINEMISQAEKIQTLRSGTKNLALNVDTSGVAEKVDNAIKAIEEKFTTRTQKIATGVSINSDGISKEIDNAIDNKAGLNLSVQTNIDTNTLSTLMDQIDRIVALTPQELSRKVTLDVNVSNFIKEVQEALAIINSINPKLIENDKSIANEFDNLFAKYRSQSEAFNQAIKSFEDNPEAFGTKEFSSAFDKANKKARELFDTVNLLHNLISKNEFLSTSRDYSIAQMPESPESLLRELKSKASGIASIYEDELGDDQGKIDELYDKFNQLFNFKIDSSSLKDNLNELTSGVNGTTRSTQSSLEVIKAVESAFTKITSKVNSFQEATNNMLNGLNQTTIQLKTAFNDLNGNVDAVKSTIITDSNEITRKADEFGKINEQVKDIKIQLETLSKITNALKSPFNLDNFATVNKALDNFDRQMQNLIDKYSNTEINLTIKTNDALNTLSTAANNVEAMIQAQKVFEKWLGKYHKDHPISQDTYANIGGSEAVSNALAKYVQIFGADPKDITLEFNSVGIDNIKTVYDQITDKIVKIGFESNNLQEVSSIEKSLNAIGSVENKQNNNSPLTPSSVTLTEVNANISGVINKLEEIRTLLPTLKIETVQESNIETPDFKTPLDTISQNSGEIINIFQSLSNLINQSSDNNTSDTTPDPVLSEILARLTSIDAKTIPIDANNNVPDNKSSIIAQYMSLIDSRLKNIQEVLLTINTSAMNSNSENVGEINDDTRLIDMLGTIEQNMVEVIGQIGNVTNTLDQFVQNGTNKDVFNNIFAKLQNLPTKLENIQRSASAITKRAQPIQTNTGNTSTKVAQVRDTIKTKADNMISHLSALEGKADNDQSNNLPTADNITSLQSALKDLTTAIQSPQALENAQGNQNLNNAPSTAEAAANLASVSDMRVQAENRLKEFRKVLGIMSGGEFSDIFGSTHDIEAYITSLETLNKEIASAGKLLNRGDISSTQRANAQNMLHTNNAILNGYINGDDSLGISTSQINNINSLLTSMETINSRIGKTDSALESLKKLKTTLESYNITIQPLEDAINTLNATKTQLQNMATTLSSSSLTEGELSALQATIASEETSYQNAINTATTMLDTDQADSLHSVTNSFVEAEREVGKYSGKLNELKKFLQDLKNKQVDLTAFNMGNGKTAKDMQDFINNYEQFLNTNNTLNDTAAMQNFANNFAANYQTPLKQFVNNLQDARLRFSEMNAEARQVSQGYSFDKQLSDMATRVTKWGNSNSQALKVAEFNAEYQRILTSLTNGSTTEIDQLKKLKSEFAMLTLRVNQAGVATKSLTQKLKEMFKKYGGWTLVTRTLNTAMRLLRSMVTQVKEVDTAMTNLSKVTEATGRQLDNFLESAGKRSVDLGASLTDYINAVSEFSRLGKNLDEAQKLGELATTYKTVAEDLDIKTASQSLISTMQAYSNMGVQAEEIVDKFNYVGNNFAISSADIGVSLQKSAASLNAAENSLAESIGLITAGNEIVQNAEVIGTHLKTISARIRGATSELGDDAEEMTITTSELRKELKELTKVDIMIDDNHFKNTYDILEEISKIYDTLTDTQRSRVSELLGGRLGSNTIESILSNFETAQKVVKELDEGMAKGSATKELEKSLDSIQGKLGQLQSTWQQLSKDTLNSSTVKGFVDILRELLSTIDKLVKTASKYKGFTTGLFATGLAQMALKRTTGSGVFSITKDDLNVFGGLTTRPQNIMDYATVQNQLQNAITAKEAGNTYLTNLPAINNELREYVRVTDSASATVEGFYASQVRSARGIFGTIQAIRTYNNISQQDIDTRNAYARAVSVSNVELGNQLQSLNGAEASMGSYIGSLAKAKAAQIGMSIATGLLNAALNLMISFAIQGIVNLTHKYEDLQEKNAQFAESLKETTDSLESERKEIHDLLSQYSRILTSTTDLTSEKETLLDIQEKLTKAFGDESEGLDLVGESYSKNIALIQKLQKESAKSFVDDKENSSKYNEAKQRMEESASVDTGYFHDKTYGNITKISPDGLVSKLRTEEEAAILKKYQNAHRSDAEGDLYISGTIEEQLATLELLIDDFEALYDANKKYDNSDTEWIESAKKKRDALKTEIAENKRYIEEFEKQLNISTSEALSKVSQKNIDKIQEAVEILKTATSSSDIIKASDSYEALKEGILAAIPEDDVETRDMLTTYFDNIEKTIDQGLLDITNKGTVYAQTLKKFQDETYDKVTGSISKLDSAIKSVSLGDSIDASSVVELAKIDSSLLNQFHRTADGYTVSLDLLSKAREKLIKEQGEDIKKEIAENEKYITDQQAILKHLREELAKAGGKDATTENAIKETEKNIEQAAERTDWWKTLLQLVANSFDTIKDKAEQAKSSFDSSLSDVKSLKDSLTSLYSKEGLDDSFFADHPELLKYKGDVEKLSAEIQKMAKTKTAPALTQLSSLLYDAKKKGDVKAIEKYTSMIKILQEESDFTVLEEMEKQKKVLREQIEAKERYIKGLERQKEKEQQILDALNKQKEELEKIVSDYETAAKTAESYIDEQIEALDKQTDALEENKKAIEDDFDARIQAIKDAMDAIDAEADALDKEAEQQERLNDLKEKELALEKARQTKVRVYDATRGFRIENNSEEISKAQKDYNDALNDYNKWKAKEERDARKAELQAQIDLLEKEKEAALDAIDKQIEGIEAMKKEFEEYKKLWEDTLNSYQKLQDEMTAAAILGSDWREKIAQKDVDIVNTFGANYNSVQEQLHGVVEKQIEDVQRVIDSYDQQIEVQNNLKSAQESYLGYYENYSEKFVNLTDKQTAALERLNQAINGGDSEGALDAVLAADAAFAENNPVSTNPTSKIQELISKGQTDAVDKFLKTAPSLITDQVNTMLFNGLPPIMKNMLRDIVKTGTENMVQNDNRSVVVNNPSLSMTYEQFMGMLSNAFAQLDRDTKVGRR